ncbi:cytochrome P450 family protein [Rhizoctonia solani AG-3 Rhs1AP]|uniref:Cytochrome P450 family protein n=1 Tax=Rhizoctonia solani AG-3 Rhs1AP TaxID=1086054 RepID=X8JDV6_9AGAM|nr:cytochrome P450 family protein [Rhizoctonia solani AG-3 Rhs1AP]
MWIFLILAALVFYGVFVRQKSLPLPPGPPGKFILGNALEIRNARYLWLKLDEYAKSYGDMFTFRLLGRPTVVLSNPHTITELFEKRATTFSSRPIIEMAKLSGWTDAILFVPYGPRLRTYRRFLHQTLNPRATLEFQSLQVEEMRKFMKRLLNEPERFYEHARLYAGAVSIRIAYGHTARSSDDKFIRMAEDFMSAAVEASTPGRWLVETIPLLRFIPSWFPGASFKRKTEEWAKMTVGFRQEPFDYVIQNMAKGTAEPSFTSKLLEPEDGREIDASEKEMIKVVASNLYGAGADSSSALLQSFFLAMTLYPRVQAKAQAEIDAYLTCARVLTIEDREYLPYTHAVVSEVIRWHPVANIVARYTQEDEAVGEYVIPKRTLVLGNLWTMLHDPELYHNPENFYPERFLGDNPAPDPETCAFGFGRRVCPGIHIAQQSLWITISNLLANFEISKARNADGLEITPSEDYTKDIISRPLPFECSIQPRSTASQVLVDDVEL